MAKTILLAVVAVLALTPAANAAAPAFKVGDAVVAEWEKGGWYAGQVESVDKDGVTVAWADGSSPSAVAADRVYAVPGNEKRALKAGTLAFCGYPEDQRWYDCKLSEISDKGASVAYLDGDTGEVTWGQIVVPTGTPAKDLAAPAKGGGGDRGGGGGAKATASGGGGTDDGFQPMLKNDDSEPHDSTLEGSPMHSRLGALLGVREFYEGVEFTYRLLKRLGGS